MRVAFVGSRDFLRPDLVVSTVARLPQGTVVVSGAADGVDSIAAGAARARGLEVVEYPVDREGLPPYPAGRAEFRRRAFARNTLIVEDADVVVAFWDGVSHGTKDSIDKAVARRKRTKVIIVRADE